jgi:hypothetical protein
MTLTLRLLHAALGTVAIGISLSIIFLGAAVTADFFETLFNASIGQNYPLSGIWPPTMDSELRFYAALWGAYGLVMIAVARDLRARSAYVPPLAAVFFVGGVGRAWSYLLVGPPHPFFIVLMITELVLPVVVIALWLGVRARLT